MFYAMNFQRFNGLCEAQPGDTAIVYLADDPTEVRELLKENALLQVEHTGEVLLVNRDQDRGDVLHITRGACGTTPGCVEVGECPHLSFLGTQVISTDSVEGPHL